MRRARTWIAWCGLVACLTYACGEDPQPQSVEQGCEPPDDIDQVEVQWAEGFSVSYHQDYKLVEVHTGAGADERYLLWHCAQPTAEQGITQAFEIPVQSAITTSTTEIPAIVDLSVLDRLVGHSTLSYVSDPRVRERIDRGELREVMTGGVLNLEVMIELAPDIVFSDVLGDPSLDTTGQGERLRDAGVGAVRVPSYLETSPLGRAEWIKFIAVFFDREAEANRIFDAIVERYTELAELAARATERPRVISGSPNGDTWRVPGGESFAARLLADAGADYPWRENESTGSIALATERVFQEAVSSDIWLHPWHGGSREALIAHEPRLETIPALENGQVYLADRRISEHGGNDYWESGMARPDLVLADLLAIMHPDLIEHALVYHRRIDEPRLPGLTDSAVTAVP
ncbi:MAG: ABC transporter substrate-binding protein [Acidobacteriota bacterium]